MEKIKDHWPKIAAVSAVAIALGLLVYSRQAPLKEKVVVVKGKDGKVWPIPRQIINMNDSSEVQKQDLESWLKNKLKGFFTEFGPFRVDEQMNLNEEDFQRVYDLIESVGRYELQKLRENNEATRAKIFKAAFVDLDDKNAKKNFNQYILKVQDDMDKEISFYSNVQENILQQVMVNENTWNNSMEAYLPPGENYIRRALRFSMSSPFKYDRKKNEKTIEELYTSSMSFGLKQLTESKLFNESLEEQGIDEQDKLIYLDYLVIDFLRENHAINSNEFKSAVSTYNLLDKKPAMNQIELVVNQFK